MSSPVQERKVLHRKKRNFRQIPADDNAAMPRFQHPSHAFPLVAAQINPKIPLNERPRWTCNLCKYTCVPDSEQRTRYVSLQPSEDVNICGVCLNAQWSAWHTQKQNFIRGGEIVVIKLMSLGVLSMTEKWPEPHDHAGMLELLDDARRKGDLPWTPRDPREIHISATHIKIAADRYQPDPTDQWEWSEPKYFQEIPIDLISTLSYLDDAPFHHVLLGCSEYPHGECHIISCDTREKAKALFEALNNAFQFVYEQAVICDLNDNIDAGLEGRPTAIQRQAEFLKNQQLSPIPSMGTTSSRLGTGRTGTLNGGGQHLSVFNIFSNGSTRSTRNKQDPRPISQYSAAGSPVSRSPTGQSRNSTSRKFRF
eukprot:m.24990 g.24990  ORF g.24990 m.24990 type:complete len:367 (+) comp7662_c0_seq3:260-1360(+)